jgi:hypothetical protein
VESEPRPELSSGGALARIVATALVMLLFTVSSTRADEGACGHLSAARVADLLAIPSANPFCEFLPPGVRCTSERLLHKPAVCTLRRTITYDRMIGGQRRLLVVRTVARKGKASDYVFAFGCVDGRIQSVLHDRFHPSARIETASLESITIKGSDQRGNWPDRMTFYWDAEWQEYLTAPGLRGAPAAGPAVKCGDLASTDAGKLIAILRDGFAHGLGCYSDDPKNDPSGCDWKATLKTDLMLAGSRRRIVVWDSHQTGSGAWDYLYVFGCINGRIGPVFDDRFLYGVGIDDASLDQLLLSRGGERMRYSWSGELQSYILKSVHISN